MTIKFSLLLRLLPVALFAAPTFADFVVLEPDKDNTLYRDVSGATSNGSGQYLFSGITAMISIRRGLLHFDVAGAIPAGSTVESVRLVMRMNMTIAGPQNVSLHPASADWGEGASDAPGNEGAGTTAAPGDATWLHTFHAGSFWNTVGGDFASTASATSSVDGFGFYTWGSSAGLVGDVQGWLDQPASNFGWVLKHDNEIGVSTAKRFASRDHSNPDDWPQLEIAFAPPGGCPTTPYCLANPNSTEVSARIFAVGDCSIAANDFTLVSRPVPNQPGIFFYGDNPIQVVFGNGYLCVGGGIVRLLPPVVGSGNEATRPVDLIARGIPPGTKNFQYWYRDAMGGGSGFNLSDGIVVVFVP